jgi:cation diffusion facilitator family transporter
MGSISIISEAIHSLSDLLAAIIAYFSIRISSEPADKEHQFGHGKFEDLSGLIESLLIVLAAIYIIFESVRKIQSGEYGHIMAEAGIAVMLLSVVVNFFVSKRLFKVAEKTDSVALLADAQHLRTDMYTSFGILIAMIGIRITGLGIIDPIIAIIVAIILFKIGVEISLGTIKNLLDASLPIELQNNIKEIVLNIECSNKILNIKKLRTRKAGAQKVIKLTLIVPENMTIKEGHELCDIIEYAIEKELENTYTVIHLEPCEKTCHCNTCFMDNK